MKSEGFPVPIMDFTKVSGELFDAEYALDNNDLVFHFFPKEGTTTKFWHQTFPEKAEPIIMDFFKATYPALKMAFTTDFNINSWWLKATGLASRGDPETKCRLLIERLFREVT